MRSLNMIFAVLVFVMAISTVQAQRQVWTVESSDTVNKAVATLNGCNVSILRNGWIHLNTKGQVLNWTLEHDLLLRLSGKTMEVFTQHWSTEDKVEIHDLVPPDIFWDSCGALLPLLPDKILVEFRGWHQLPIPAKNKK